MFIIVKYGDNQNLLCNPDCISVNLLSFISKRIGLTLNGSIFDLSDTEGMSF